MLAFDHIPDEELPSEDGYLGYYRAAVERLRGETVAEVGTQPMPPEKLSMFAVALASLPLVALMHPAIPAQPVGWEIALSLSVVWLIAYRFQARRYDRFLAVWRRKVAAHHAAEVATLPADLRFLHG